MHTKLFPDSARKWPPPQRVFFCFFFTCRDSFNITPMNHPRAFSLRLRRSFCPFLLTQKSNGRGKPWISRILPLLLKTCITNLLPTRYRQKKGREGPGPVPPTSFSFFSTSDPSDRVPPTERRSLTCTFNQIRKQLYDPSNFASDSLSNRSKRDGFRLTSARFYRMTRRLIRHFCISPPHPTPLFTL